MPRMWSYLWGNKGYEQATARRLWDETGWRVQRSPETQNEVRQKCATLETHGKISRDLGSKLCWKKTYICARISNVAIVVIRRDLLYWRNGMFLLYRMRTKGIFHSWIMRPKCLINNCWIINKLMQWFKTTCSSTTRTALNEHLKNRNRAYWSKSFEEKSPDVASRAQ